MKKRLIFRAFCTALCLILCLQFCLAAGILSLSVSAASLSVPSATTGITKAQYKDFPAGNSIVCFTGVENTTELGRYLTAMENAGFTQTGSHQRGNVYSYSFTHASGRARLVWSQNEKLMYVVTDNGSVTSPYTARTNYTKVTDTTLAMFSLDHSNRPLTDSNGMCQIFILEDGSYLILDGGYTWDSERLYNFLLDNNRRTDGKVVIHAWYFTHGHADHYGAFQQFSADHCKDVTLEYVISSSTPEGDWLNLTLPTLMSGYGGAKLVRPHTGEVYQMPGLSMEIFYTCEDLYQYNESVGCGNDSSTVCKITVGGQTILYVGDAETNACKKMNAMYGTNLHADFFQVNHHGYSGGISAFFDNVKPTYLIWTSSQAGMELRTINTYYQWQSSSFTADYYHLYNKYIGTYNKVFAADGPVELMTFPYDGNRSALELYTVDDTVRLKDASAAWSENFDSLTPGSYTVTQLAAALGWPLYVDADTNTTFEITSNGKLHVALPFQSPAYQFDATTGVGSPKMNGEIFLNMGSLPHFTNGRTVIEYEMTYHESIIPAVFGAPFRVRNTTKNGVYFTEVTVQADGTVANRYRYDTNWHYLDNHTPRPEVYNRLTTDYITNPDFQYGGYIITDNYKNFPKNDGTYGVYESTMTKSNYTIFGSTDRYKIVIDPNNGIDVYINDTLVSSTRVTDAWGDVIYEDIIGTQFGLRLMPGMDVTVDNISVTREDLIPELLITELAPNGTNSWNEFVEVYNNSNRRINIYDYCLLIDDNPASESTFGDSNVMKILPGTTTFVSPNNSANRVTHTNPAYEDGWLEAGEVALLWVPTNTLWNTSAVKPGNGNTLADFRRSLNLSDDQKAFVCYNNYAHSLNNGGNYLYAIGHADMNYVGTRDTLFGNFVSYVYHLNDALSDYVGSGTVKFKQTFPKTTFVGTGSIRYYYPENNAERGGKLLAAENNVSNPGVLDTAQIRQVETHVTVNGQAVTVFGTTLDLTPYVSRTDVGVTVTLTDSSGNKIETQSTTVTVSEGMAIEVFEGDEALRLLYSENFDSYSQVSYTMDDGHTSTYSSQLQSLKNLLGWEKITATDGSEWELTSDGKLRIYNPYYSTYQSDKYSTPNYDIQVQIGHFEELVGRKVVFEYDFQYNERGASGTSAASFVFGRYVDRSGYCFTPAITAQGFYRPKIGSQSSGGTTLHAQIRPEWIPYTKKTTGYTYPYGGVTNHYNIFGGTNHVKIEIDPYNGMSTSVNGVMISMVQDTAAWETLYATNMGNLLGLSVSNGLEVVLDNLKLYVSEQIEPDLLITEVGNAMGKYEYIEVYNNSDRVLDIYDYKLMRNTDLVTDKKAGNEYLGIGASWGNPIRWTNANIATILPGTHTYTAQASGQSVTLTNPTDGSILPGETAILWVPSNTTFDDTTSKPEVETREMFMEFHGLTDSDKIFAAYNNNNLSLWDSGNIGYGIGYANVDYTTHNAYAMNELVSYVYVNTESSKIYNVEVGVTKHAAAYASIEYSYAHNNSARRGTLLSSVAGEKSPGYALDAQKRTVTLTLGTQNFQVPLGVNPELIADMSLSTLRGASVRINAPTGLRWLTAVSAEDYQTLQAWKEMGVVTDITIGTIIMRTSDLGSGTLSYDRVNETNCFFVKAYDTAWFDENPTVEEGYDASLANSYIFAGSVVNLKQEHYAVKYSAVGCLRVTLADGSVRTVLGGYSADAHARSVAEVAYAALADANSGLSAAEKDVLTGFAAYYQAT